MDFLLPLTKQEKEWLALPSDEFHYHLMKIVKKEKDISSVFAAVVQHNVSEYVMATFFPHKYSTWQGNRKRLAFAVAETGWKGNIRNIKTTISYGKIKGSKSYVMNCEELIVFSKYKDKYALVFLEKDHLTSIAKRAKLRKEKNAHIYKNGNMLLGHYHIQLDETIALSNILELTKKDYAKVALQIPRREITTFALFALALQGNVLHFVERIIQEKQKGMIQKETAKKAAEILLDFTKEKSLPPIWESISKLASFFHA